MNVAAPSGSGYGAPGAAFAVDSPRLETQDEDKAVLRRHQKPSCGEKGDFPSVGTRGACGVQALKAPAQRKHDQDEQQRRSEDAVDAHQGENSASGAVVEEFQFSRRYAVDLYLLTKSLQWTNTHCEWPLLLKMCTKSVTVWPCQLPGSTSSALHADWKTNVLHHQG